MFKINENYLKLPGSYLFSTVGKKQRAYEQAHPDKKVIRLSIGDVTQPLVPAIITALHGAVDEMAKAEKDRPRPDDTIKEDEHGNAVCGKCGKQYLSLAQLSMEDKC